MTMIESTNLEISNTQNEAVHPIRSGVLNALVSGLKLILIPTDCSDHSRISIKYGIRLAQESNATIKLICVQESFDSDEDPVLISRDGHRIMIDAAAAPIYNGSEEITGAVLTIRNVSSRKKAEMELAEARNLLTNLLTPREKEILKMMVNGSTTKEIAYDLEISPRTVEAHRQNMMSKLQVVDMPMLIRYAVTHRLVPLE